MNQTLNPSSRPRRGVLTVLGAGVATALVSAAIVLGGSTPVEASGLSSFTSCAELRDWGTEQAQVGVTSFEEVGAAIDSQAPRQSVENEDAAAPTANAPSTTGAAQGDVDAGSALPEGEDTTNVIVEGIDEPDLVERLGGDLALVRGGQTLAIADLSTAQMLASTTVPWDAQITFDAEADVAWAVGSNDQGLLEVRRFTVGDAMLNDAGSWTTRGQLVSARRQGGELLVVATDWFVTPVPRFEEVGPGSDDSGRTEPSLGADAIGPDDTVPFAGAPVPCEDVLHPAGPAEATATLLVVLPVEGDLAPLRSAEVVGSGSLVHVTNSAAYLATPSWANDGAQVNGLHRFDLASLTHTGSGQVEGTLLNDFSISDHDGYLRVAVTHGGGWGMPMPIEPGIASGPDVDAVFEVPAEEADDALIGPSAPETTIADAGVAEEPMPSQATEAPRPTIVEPDRGEALNEIVVFDTEGDLDEVGRTARFGHPGESLRGVRFDGTIAYAVTFLQTDPFYVVDLATPSNPTILGELELPGFSSYLHPISATEVVGFGPDESGRASAKLFDVSDRANPRVVDSIVLGDESPVQWDHHAFVSLGTNRFAVPAASWNYNEQVCVDAPCDYYPTTNGMQNSVVVLSVSGGRLVEEQRIDVMLAESALRVMPAGDGWALLASASLTVVDGAGSIVGVVDLP